MSTPGSRARSAGVAIMMLFVSAGIHSGAGGFGLLLCFAGLLAGVGITVVGVRMAKADNPAPIVPAVFDGARALAALLRGNLTVVGLVMASCAVMAVSGEAGPVLCFATFALLLLGLSMINVAAVYDRSGNFASQACPGAGRGEVLVGMILDCVGTVYNGFGTFARHDGEVLVGLLRNGDDAAHNNSGNFALQRPDIGGEDIVGLLPDGVVGAVYDSSGNFARQLGPGAGGGDDVPVGLLPDGVGAGHDTADAPADGLGTVYGDNPGMMSERLRRLLPCVAISVCSAAVSGLAAGPDSPAVAFDLFLLLLAGLFLVILHVLRA
ncbi:hypothetical protein BAE44_0010564 [Dichanthelium oligosanthes]|uniref:Uncharacterized protein n=1 Tax=Dichanthelium oligosanthes TaxID=888268 RepID=A0A1E5VTH0_9POAL|nr:hypothetical protein BAE44_0010564 [Dichanthelium oligosanthes]